MDPDYNPFTAYIRMQGFDYLPQFIKANYSNGTFTGYPTTSDIGTYIIEVVGIDDSLAQTVT